MREKKKKRKEKTLAANTPLSSRGASAFSFLLVADSTLGEAAGDSVRGPYAGTNGVRGGRGVESRGRGCFFFRLLFLRADRFLLSRFSFFRPTPTTKQQKKTGREKVQGGPRALLPARPQAVRPPLGLLGPLAAAPALGARRRLGRGRAVRPLGDPPGPARRDAGRRPPRLPRAVAAVPPGQEPGPRRRGLLCGIHHEGLQGAHRRGLAGELREVRPPRRAAVVEDEHRAARMDVLEGREGGSCAAGAADRRRGAGAADAGR